MPPPMKKKPKSGPAKKGKLTTPESSLRVLGGRIVKPSHLGNRAAARAAGPAIRHELAQTATSDWMEWEESEQADPSYDPQAIFQEQMAAARSDARTLTPLEQFTLDWKDDFREFKTAAGTVSIRKGWGHQPFIQSRAANFGDVSVKLDYDSICEELEAGRTSSQQEDLAWDILGATMGKPVTFEDYDDATRRAAAHLIAITQVAEEHKRRNPGAAIFARAGLQAIADSTYTFSDVFGRAHGHYLAAHVGGKRKLETAIRDREQIDELLAGLVHPDELEDFDDSMELEDDSIELDEEIDVPGDPEEDLTPYILNPRNESKRRRKK